MDTRRSFTITASIFALSLLVAAGCTPDDPSSDDDEDTSGATTAGADTNGSGTGGMDTNGGSGGMDTNGGTGGTDTMGGTGGTDTDGGGSGGDTDIVDDCKVLSNFNGQVDSMVDHGGGTPTSSTSDLPADTGIQGVWDWIKNNKSAVTKSEKAADIPMAEQVEIDGAVVISTSFGNTADKHFYIQDQKTAIYVRLESAPMAGGSAATINVGDAVSFTVTGANMYDGQPQIAKVTNFSKKGTGKKVPIQQVDASTISPDMYNQMVRLGGRLTNRFKCDSKDRDCSKKTCYMCYDLVNESGDKLVTFRSNAFTTKSKKGYFDKTCITFVGPLSMYEGPMSDKSMLDPPKDRLQVSETNFDWTKRPGSK